MVFVFVGQADGSKEGAPSPSPASPLSTLPPPSLLPPQLSSPVGAASSPPLGGFTPTTTAAFTPTKVCIVCFSGCRVIPIYIQFEARGP